LTVTRSSNAATLECALAFFADLGLDPPEAVMTDNAPVYRRSRRFRQSLAHRRIRTPAYTPRWQCPRRSWPPRLG
jgi:hypothetical protein